MQPLKSRKLKLYYSDLRLLNSDDVDIIFDYLIGVVIVKWNILC